MKKTLLTITLCLGALLANADNYSTASLSYDNMHLQYGSNFGEDEGLFMMGQEGNGMSLNGFGLQYSYGFGLGKLPMNLEVGLKWNMIFNQTSEKDYDYDYDTKYIFEEKFNTRFMRLSIPISYIYHFNLKNNIVVAPYAGVDLRFNLLGSTTYKYIESDKYGKVTEEEKWNYFSKEDMGDATFNRFQFGWHLGVRLEYTKIFLGLEYGTDFNPLFSYKDDIYKEHINTGNFSLNIGYKF